MPTKVVRPELHQCVGVLLRMSGQVFAGSPGEDEMLGA
jgi:hypothetical protein